MVSTPANEPTLTLTPEQFQRLTIHAVHRHLPLSDTLTELLAAPPPGNSRRPWSDHELAMLRDPRNTPKRISKATGRTPAAVSNRRNQLARDENRPELMRAPRQPAPPPQPPTREPLPDDVLKFCAYCDERATTTTTYPPTSHRTPEVTCNEHTPV